MEELVTWLIQSRKAQVALGALLTIFLSRLLPKWGFSSEDINVISGSIAAVAAVWIGGISHEDAAAKSGPQNQTNVNSDVRNTPVVPVPATSTPQPAIDPQQQLVEDVYAQVLHRLEARAAALNKARAAAAKPEPLDAPKGN